MESSASGHFGIYESLADAFPDSLIWEWDHRFGGVLAAFESEDKDRVSAVITAQFPQAWDGVSVNDATEDVSSAMERFGGLHPGQRLYVADLNENTMLFGLWWPWSNGTTISIRLIPHSPGAQEFEAEELHAAMKPIFGL